MYDTLCTYQELAACCLKAGSGLGGDCIQPVEALSKCAHSLPLPHILLLSHIVWLHALCFNKTQHALDGMRGLVAHGSTWDGWLALVSKRLPTSDLGYSTIAKVQLIHEVHGMKL